MVERERGRCVAAESERKRKREREKEGAGEGERDEEVDRIIGREREREEKGERGKERERERKVHLVMCSTAAKDVARARHPGSSITPFIACELMLYLPSQTQPLRFASTLAYILTPCSQLLLRCQLLFHLQ